MRKHFAPKIVLMAAMAGASLSATAKLRELQLFPPDSVAEPGELIHMPDGGYLVTASVADVSRPNELQRRGVMLRIDQNLRVTGEFDIPFRFTEIRPFGDHYVGQMFKDYEHRHLAVFDADGNIVRTLYENDERISDLDFVTAENGHAIYVLEQLFNFRSRLHRFTADGKHEWRHEFTNEHAYNLVATSNGVVLPVQPHGPQPPMPSTTIVAISASGKPLWRAVLPHDPQSINYQFVALPDRVAIRRFFTDGRRPRLKLLNAASGNEVTDVDTPPANAMRATDRGFLLHGQLAGYPYLALLDKNGKMQWWRRFRFKNNWGALANADIAPSGKVVVLGRHTEERNLYGERPAVVLIEADADGKELTQTYGRCLDVDPALIDDLQNELRLRYGMTVTTAPQGDERRQSRDDECSAPTDRDHLAFLQSLANSPLLREKFHPLGTGIRIQLDPHNGGAQLLFYNFNTAVLDAPSTSLGFRVGLGESAVLQRILADEVQPHLEIMERRALRFLELTGYQVAVTRRNLPVSDPALFSKLENSASRLLEIISGLPQAQLESIRRQRRLDVYPHLAPDAFGFYNDLRPLDSAVATLNEMISKGREIPQRN